MLSGDRSVRGGHPISIKMKPEDFFVEEIAEIPKNERGRYLIVKAEVIDWDTNKVVEAMASALRISRKRISYAGTKDKRATKIQYFCINAPVDVSDLAFNGFRVLETFRSDHYLKLGDLTANHFRIRFQGPDDSWIMDQYTAMMERGGFPNYFGQQRFGSRRSNTHDIGRLIVMGKYEDAVRLYIYDERYDTEDYRRKFIETLDHASALEEFPRTLKFERSLIGYYAQHHTFEGAFDALPKNLAIMFVHAYQSYLFNKMLSARIERYGLNTAIPGDVAYPVDTYFNPDKSRPIEVNEINVNRINELIRSDKIRITIPIIGSEVGPDRSEFGEIEARILEEEHVETDMFRNREYPHLSSTGDRRIVSAKPLNFSVSGNVMDFILGRGIYATTLISEFGDLMDRSVSSDWL
ncbi:tRNA pseudouridine(13) synthase TruD [Thermoplasma sp. Kam2015]|uniref:tRNA pseudouridine(13) synthase TruD n=1 Tax=Thermoplasma sp. Kam2015 TaxID=2094122 RepID=UPI000D90D956|nr:tRNA pseudouridine(13) synthase TruD [Thermoplasma sp. Kam2015]PYB68972.1 tRNA pseudouridine(13) synthase TruD [Thermoplasma sp. Kam2015]